MVGKGITSGEVLIERTINLLRYTLMYDGLGVQFLTRPALHCLYAGPDVVDLDLINAFKDI